MSESRFNPAKPLAITAICIIGLINAIQMLNVLLSPMVKQLGVAYAVYFGAAALISLVCIGGLWFLRRWSAWVYAVVLLINQLVLVTMGLWESTALVVPLVIIGVILRHFKQLRS